LWYQPILTSSSSNNILLKKFCLCAAVLFLAQINIGQPLYKDARQPIEKRVKDLLGRMTIEEKFWQLFMIPGDLDPSQPEKYRYGIFGLQVSAGAAGDAGGQLLQYNTSEDALLVLKKINSIQKYFVEETRLGIPIIAFDEALHGLVRKGATVFPQSIGLAASFDTTLMRSVSAAIARETSIRGIRQVLSPVVNIATDIRWGRTEETYGEDPFLAAAMGVAFVQPFEEKGIITTPKHFIANVGDGGRDSYPVHFNERILNEIHFPPFIACIKKGGARSVMTAYNSVDGIAASSNAWLLQQQLKEKWGFEGFVISDANAVGGELVLHNTAKDYAASGEHAINAGLDVIFQTEHEHYKLFIPAFLEKKIDSNRLNDAVARVLKAKFELGLFENPYADEKSIAAFDPQQSKTLARKAALKSFVLLKNEVPKNKAGKILPISPTIQSITVVGIDAVEARLGGYSGPGNKKISILEGLQQRFGNRIKINYAPGPGRVDSSEEVIPAAFLRHSAGEGLRAAYFSNPLLEGEPAVQRIDKNLDFRWTLYAPDNTLSADHYAARWTGELLLPAQGIDSIGLEGNDGYRLYLGKKLLIDRWQKTGYHKDWVPLDLPRGKYYPLTIEFYESSGNATIKLIWKKNTAALDEKIRQAANMAKNADLNIVVAGISEGEFNDRAILSLPGRQEELIHAVAATGKPMLVLLVGGSAITMNNWINKADAIASVWYPGEEGGAAIAEILSGDFNPAGRLPISFPMHEGQLPLSYLHKPTGRGDDYNNLSGKSLFPFGYGLSYSQFEYSHLKLSRNNISSTDSVIVSFDIKNISQRHGEEVPQLYIRDLLASVARPLMELKGFQRVFIKAGETKHIEFKILPEMLSMLNKDLQTVIEPGEFRIMVGPSSNELPLKINLTVK
jgi:beta-glucosidase